MTRLLERLEHVLGPRPLRTTAPPRHRLERHAAATSSSAITPEVDPSAADPTTGFRDCRGEWHAWEDAS